MNAQDIEDYLAELGQELARLGIQAPFRILMVGGAYMLTQVGNRKTTRDIDVLLEDMLDPHCLAALPTISGRCSRRGYTAHAPGELDQ